MKISKTKIAVAGFIALSVYLFWAEKANAETQAVFGLGAGAFETQSLITQRIGIERNQKWGFIYERFGDGMLDGHASNSVAVYRRVQSNGTFLRARVVAELGAAYFDEKIVKPTSKTGRVLVNENLAWHLGLGAQWDLSESTSIQLKLTHNSTAGRSEPNTGIDRVSLSYTFKI